MVWPFMVSAGNPGGLLQNQSLSALLGYHFFDTPSVPVCVQSALHWRVIAYHDHGSNACTTVLRFVMAVLGVLCSCLSLVHLRYRVYFVGLS